MPHDIGQQNLPYRQAVKLNRGALQDILISLYKLPYDLSLTREVFPNAGQRKAPLA